MDFEHLPAAYCHTLVLAIAIAALRGGAEDVGRSVRLEPFTGSCAIGLPVNR
jgi:hypothetical protein